MATPEVYKVNPWPRWALLAWLFLTGAAIGSYLNGHDSRDWSVSSQWTKITTLENVTTGERTVIQEQSGSTETRTNPATPNTPGVGIFGAGDGK